MSKPIYRIPKSSWVTQIWLSLIFINITSFSISILSKSRLFKSPVNSFFLKHAHNIGVF